MGRGSRRGRTRVTGSKPRRRDGAGTEVACFRTREARGGEGWVEFPGRHLRKVGAGVRGVR